MKKELFSKNGDWNQESGGAPLKPDIDRREMATNTFDHGPPIKLVSFWLKNVDPIHRTKNTVSVSGVMQIGAVRSLRTASFSDKPYDWSPNFYMRPDYAKLTILFEGIYIESKENGRQMLMCLLGNATIPSASSPKIDSCEHGDPWRPCQPQVNNLLSAVQDDQIMLVLQYPKTFTLTRRGIIGELNSLNLIGNLTYFDKVHISSQLGEKSKYQFKSEELVSSACSPYPYLDSLINRDIEMFKGENFCEHLRQFVWNEVFVFESTWKNIVKTKHNSSKIGPFIIDKRIETTYNSSDKLRLMIQQLECKPGTDQEGMNTAIVSAVLRVVQKSEYLYREEMRTGISTMTLSAERRWHSSHGQLCMVGCLGSDGSISDRCRSRITLHFPVTFSINQQSTVLGTISSINRSEGHAPLVFRKLITIDFWSSHQWNRQFKRSYSYTKIMQAREFRRRSQPSSWVRNLRKSIFKYPSSKGEDIASFSFLTDVLSKVWGAPQTLTDSKAPKTNLNMVLRSIGFLFGRYDPYSYQEKLEFGKAFHSTSKNIEISGHLKIEGGQFYNLSLLFEGIYDPTLGQMYLIGCRDVQEFNNDNRNIERGLDCLIEIKVEYSAKNARWLLNPNIKFSINSKRNKEYPFYIPSINTNTFLISYTKKFDFVLLRKVFEEGLRILLLVMVILCIRGQLRYIENQGHPIAYISLVMLALHALGFSIPLITNDEILLKWKEFTPNKSSYYQFQEFHIFQALDLFIKFLMLFALLETAKLIQRVWESRKIQKGQAVNLNLRIPSDKLVFLFFLLIHMLGYFTLYTIHNVCGIPLLLQSENYEYVSVNIKRLQKWWIELENYGGLVQDCFLLPQIIGNTLWGVQGKPLRKLYYMGFTMIRLVLQAYSYASDPVPIPSYSELEFQYLGLESYYKLGNIIVSAIMVTLVMMEYIQQNWRYCKIRLIRELEDGDNLDPKPDTSYERLFSE